MGRSVQCKLAQKLNSGKICKTLHRIMLSLAEVQKLLNIK